MIRSEDGDIEFSDTECRLLAKYLVVRLCATWDPDWEDMPGLDQSALDRITKEIRQIGADMNGHLGNVERANHIDTRLLYEVASS